MARFPTLPVDLAPVADRGAAGDLAKLLNRRFRTERAAERR